MSSIISIMKKGCIAYLKERAVHQTELKILDQHQKLEATAMVS